MAVRIRSTPTMALYEYARLFFHVQRCTARACTSTMALSTRPVRRVDKRASVFRVPGRERCGGRGPGTERGDEPSISASRYSAPSSLPCCFIQSGATRGNWVLFIPSLAILFRRAGGNACPDLFVARLGAASCVPY